MTRIVTYFLPLFYLVSLIMLQEFECIYKNKLIITFIFLILSLNIYNNYPKKFFIAPYVPSEVGYIDNNIHRDVIKKCSNSIIITAGYPGILTFFNIKPNFFLNTEITKYPQTYEYLGENKYIETYTKIPIIKNYNDFLEIYNSSKSLCVIVGELSRRNIDFTTMSFILNNMHKQENAYIPNLNGEPVLFIKD